MVEERASEEGGTLLPAIAVPGSEDQREQPADNAAAERTKQDAKSELLSAETSEVRIFAHDLEYAMERTFRYIVRRGLLVLLAIQPFYKALQRLSKFQVGERIQFKIPLLIVVLFVPNKTRIILTYCKPQLVIEDGKLTFSLCARSWFKKTLALIVPKSLRSKLDAKLIKITDEPLFHADLKSVSRAPVILALILISILGSLVILLSIPWYVTCTLVRGLAITFRSALRTVPSLFAILVVIFITGDAWKIFGLESNWQFVAIILFIAVTSIVAVIVSLREVGGDWRSITRYSAEGSELLRSWATDKTPAEQLVKMEVKPLLPPPPSKDSLFWKKVLIPHEKNISILYFITIISHVIAVAFWISSTFVVIGVITVNAAMTKELSQSRADVLHGFNFIGQQFLITRQLVLTSVVIGGIATLTFVSSTLQDVKNRQTFADYALTDLKRAIGALAYYYGGVITLLLKLRDAGVFAEFRELFTPEGRSNLQDYIKNLLMIIGG